MNSPVRLVHDKADYPEALSNVEAEAALLGALMIHNDIVDRAAEICSAEDFHEPLHGRVYAVIVSEVAAGRVANPPLLRPFFADDPAMGELGGPAYLARLTGNGAALIGWLDFARQIADLARRRRLYDAMRGLVADLSSGASIDEPIESMVGELDGAISVALQRETRTRTVTLHTAMNATIANIDDEIAGRVEPGLSALGLNDWNRATGMRPGNVIILAGRPGMGKTAVAVSAALACARADLGTAMISLEMEIEELTRRAISDLVFQYGALPDYSQIESGRLQPHERLRVTEARDMIANWPLIFTDPASLRIGQLAMMIRRLQRQMAAKGKTLSVVFIDYLGLIKPDRQGKSRYEEIGIISRTIKQIAKECGVCIVMLAQLSRAVEQREDKRPQLSDLRDSGDIEQDADTVVFVYREEYYLERSEPDPADKKRPDWELALQASRDKLDLITAKRRRGKIGTRRMHFFSNHQAVRDGTFFKDMGR